MAYDDGSRAAAPDDLGRWDSFVRAAQVGTRAGWRRTNCGRWLPIVLQAEGGAPTQAVLAREELQRWITKARITSCGHGTAIGLPETVWQCEFIIDDRPAVIRWTRTGTAQTPVQGTTVRRLDGTTAHLGTGDSVRITESPVLIR